jgi:hypothetical protein
MRGEEKRKTRPKVMPMSISNPTLGTRQTRRFPENHKWFEWERKSTALACHLRLFSRICKKKKKKKKRDPQPKGEHEQEASYREKELCAISRGEEKPARKARPRL